VTTPQLPQVHAEDIDEAALGALFLDISVASRVVEVRVKGSPERYASPADGGFEAASRAFVERRIAGLQIRYEYRGKVWCDTLMRRDGGVRLVRIRE